jgi:hypothetical protein
MEITTSINMDSYGLNSHTMANIKLAGFAVLARKEIKEDT